MICILKEKPFQSRVSSVLNRDVKQYGKKYLFDECEETCWNSDQGSPQWIAIELESAEAIHSFKIQFQGGFAGSKCHLETGMVAGDMEKVESFYPEDVNSVQTFQLTKPVTAKYMKFVFESSTDFFGRIIVYKLEVFGAP
ncbi:nuclear receptor 2C2-associated protein [Anabrus simplex]|uniref:nuclear receptor 2C2-associated protein n=1 Tax=Anabrus simplex TaxID=316456 RepID=UPI0034DCCD9F